MYSWRYWGNDLLYQRPCDASATSQGRTGSPECLCKFSGCFSRPDFLEFEEGVANRWHLSPDTTEEGMGGSVLSLIPSFYCFLLGSRV